MEEKKSIFGDFVKSLFVIVIAIVLVLAGYAAGKYYTNKKEDNTINNNSNESTNELKDQNGTLSTIGDNSATISINEKTHTLSYFDSVEDDELGEAYLIKYDSKVIFKQGARGNGIGDINYYVFTASDNKQYLLLTYQMYGTFGILLNDNGDILNNTSEYSDEIDCFFSGKNNEKLINIKDGNIYYYQYKKDSYNEEVGVKLQEVKLTINNNKIDKSLTGKEIDGNFGQCS